MASKDNKKYKSKNLFDSFHHAFDGLIYGFRTTKNLRVDLFVTAIVIVCGFVFKISLLEWALLTICFGLVMALELVNTAIEEAVNLAMPNLHPIAKISKDVAAGAVMFAAILSSVVGFLIFIPKFIDLL